MTTSTTSTKAIPFWAAQTNKDDELFPDISTDCDDDDDDIEEDSISAMDIADDPQDTGAPDHYASLVGDEVDSIFPIIATSDDEDDMPEGVPKFGAEEAYLSECTDEYLHPIRLLGSRIINGQSIEKIIVDLTKEHVYCRSIYCRTLAPHSRKCTQCHRTLCVDNWCHNNMAIDYAKDMFNLAVDLGVNKGDKDFKTHGEYYQDFFTLKGKGYCDNCLLLVAVKNYKLQKDKRTERDVVQYLEKHKTTTTLVVKEKKKKSKAPTIDEDSWSFDMKEKISDEEFKTLLRDFKADVMDKMASGSLVQNFASK